MDTSRIQRLPAAGTPEAAEARRPLTEAIAAIGEPPAPDASATEPADPRALKLFASARLQLLDGKPAAALADLEMAARYDPRSAEIQQEMAEAQLAMGRRAASTQSYQRAVSLGLREARAFAVIGRDSLRAGRHAEASRNLAWARAMGARSEPSLVSVVCVDLAEALLAQGQVAAARDALEEGLNSLTPPSSASRSIADIADVFRRRGELWLLAGDLSCRLGETTRAASAYTQAAGTPSVESTDLLTRRVYLELLSGRSARAALLLLEQLADSEGRIDDRTLPMLTFLAQRTEAGEALAQSIGDLRYSMGPAASVTALGRLARATAASLPDAQGREILRDRLRAAPRDTETAIELLARCPSTGARVRELLDAVRSAPTSVSQLADAAISYGRDLDETIAVLESDRSGEALVLRATMLTKLGRPDDAQALLEKTAAPAALRPALLAVRAAAASETGRADVLNATLSDLDALLAGNPSPETRRTAAVAQVGARNPEAALRILEPALAPEANPSTELLLEGADLALSVGKLDQAEEYLRRAAAQDRFDERLYDSLLALYAPGGPMPDDRKFTDAARDLRQAVPSSRLIRVLTAQEQIARSLWPQAESQLLSMMDANRESSQALGLLVTVWERSAESSPELAERGEEWLRARLERRPQAPGLLMALSRVIAARGRAAEAEKLLEPRLERWPMADMARLREWIVRESLNDPDRADSLARERLARSPQTFDNCLELAELHTRHADFAAAAHALADAMPEGARLSDDQSRRVLNMLAGLKPDAVRGAGPESAEAAVRMFDLAASRGLPMPPQIHLARLTLMAVSQPQETAKLVEAVRVLGEKYPDLRLPASVRVYELLAEGDDITPALLFLPQAATLVTPPQDQLLFEWLRQTELKGDADDVDRLLRTADPKLMLEMLTRIGAQIIIPETRQECVEAFMQMVAEDLSSLDRFDLAVSTYRRILEVNPRRPMTCNNLGYLLLENGGDLEECDRLITIAHEGEPDDCHVTDSLAWVRYKRGILEDRKDADGKVTVEGAVTLLRRAVEDQDGGDREWAILDHYGDALWRTGRTEDARAQWRRTKDVIETELRLSEGLGRAQAPEPPGVVRLRKALDSVRRKIADAAASREPEIAPLANAKEP